VVVFPRGVRRPEKPRIKKNKIRSESPKDKSTNEKADENKLTFDLLLLPLEGFVCLLCLAPQVKDRGLLLLEGLAQIFVRKY
jgi:hypothetical protein